MKIIKALFITLFILILLGAGTVYVILTRYKKELAARFVEELRVRHGVDFDAGDVRVSLIGNWPHGSVRFTDVRLSSSKLPGSYLSAGAVDLSFNIRRLLDKQFIVRNVAIRDAEIVYTKPADKAPDRSQPARPDTAQTQPISFEVNKISFRHTKVSILNPAIGQEIRFNLMSNSLRLEHFTDGIQARFKGNVDIPGLLFRKNRGEFLKDSRTRVNFRIDYFADTKSLLVRPGSYAVVNGQKFDLTCLVNLGDNKKVALIVRAKDLDYERTGSLMNHKIRKTLSLFDLRNKFNADLLLVANIGRREDPVILLGFSGKKNDLTIGNSKIPYSGLSFKGKLVCMEPSMARGDIAKARLRLSDVKGRIYDFPFTAKVNVDNFSDPFIKINGKLYVDAAKIKFNLQNEFELKGTAVADIRYSGPTSKLNSTEFLGPGMRLDAKVAVKELRYKEKTRPWVYAVTGNATMNNTDLRFRNLLVKTDVAEAEVSGRIEGFVNYVLGRTNGFKANLAVKTESLDLNPVLSRYKKSPPDSLNKAPVSEETGTGDEAAATNSQMANAAAELKKNYSSFEFNVGLFAKNLRVREFLGKNAHMHLHYQDEVLDIRSIQLLACEGKIKGKGMISQFNDIKANLSIEDVEVKEMFRQFENFGQEAVVSDNLKGTLNAEVKFKSLLDDRMEVAGETMYGEVTLSLKDGHLINFEPIKKLSNFIFRNRDFNDISFSELNESFVLRGYEMQIDELEIGSNILNLYVVNGLYNFKGHSNINILLPWSNLKSRKKNYIPKSSGESVENAKGIKLNFSGPPRNLKVSFGHKELAQLRPSF